jgi:hypothetical protein
VKHSITLTSVCALAAMLFLPQASRAAGPCTTLSLLGGYSYKAFGNFADSGGGGKRRRNSVSTANPVFAASGIITFDGLGGAVITDTVSDDGELTISYVHTGKYQINSDCTGTLFIYSGAPGGAAQYNFTLNNNNAGMDLISILPGDIITGTATKQ